MKSIVQQFTGKKVLVIGDLMLDEYLWGAANRISPEAPVPVVEINKQEFRLGGAANVALNIKTLGAEPIILSVIGKDQNGEELKSLLNKREITTDYLIEDNSRKTTVKSRVFSHNQQMIRFDNETLTDIDHNISEKVITKVNQAIENGIEAIVFEDYDKGVLHPTLIIDIIKLANENDIKTATDPKKKNFLSYSGVTLFKPNLKEINEGLNVNVDSKDINSIKENVDLLRKELNHKISFLTLAADGIFIQDDNHAEIIPTVSKKVSDVSGAGDTVISVATLCMINDVNAVDMAKLANIAASIVCQKLGVSPIQQEELLAKL